MTFHAPRFMLHALLVLLTGLHVAPARASHTGDVIYVDDSASGANNGSSWANAYVSLQDALTHAASDDEIWVAEGTYTPGDRRGDTFQLKDGVAIYGGFEGTETERGQQDWQVNQTILSGDIGAPGDRSDDTYHVVTGSGTDRTAILDGVTVTRGNADGGTPNNYGGGMYTANGSPTLSNVVFFYNAAAFGGGMLNADDSNPTLINVTFDDNSAISGGGLFNDGSNPRLANVSFRANRASSSGGGMFNGGSAPELVNVGFLDNSSVSFGGGMSNDSSNPTLTNVTFNYNHAGSHGGGIHNLNSTLTLTNVTFAANSATTSGGAAFNENSSATVLNSILWSNTPNQIAQSGTSTLTIEFSVVAGGCPAGGNCGGVLDVDPRFANPVGADGLPGTRDDRLRLRSDSPAVDAGRNNLVPADTLDLDGDGDTGEPLPLDGSGAPRFVDVPATSDTGLGTAPIVDMGAYEAGPIIYVDDDASGAHDGSTWVNAYWSLQDALIHATYSDEIWVAEGIYWPSYQPGLVVSETFQLKNGVAIYGGFVGGETERSQRDWQANPTVLSGDIDRNDGRDPSGVVSDTAMIRGANSWHVVTAEAVSDTTILDGVIITAGNANGSVGAQRTAGGMLILTSDPTLANVTFSGNAATFLGGAMYNYRGRVRLENVAFSGNTAEDGGAMYNDNSSPSLAKVTFSANEAQSDGGGIFNSSSRPVLANVTFSGNDAQSGGGIYNSDSSPILMNVVFSGNSASQGGGIASESGSLTLANVTFSANSAGIGGGGIYNSDSSSLIASNSIVWGNLGEQISNTQTATLTLAYSLVEGGCPAGATCDTIKSEDPRFVDADGPDDRAGTADDNLRLLLTSPAIDAGKNGFVPTDTLDLDDDGNITERLPLDLDGRPRFVDIPSVPDTGDGPAPVIDMGAYEAGTAPPTATPTATATRTPTTSATPSATVSRTSTATTTATVTASVTATTTGEATPGGDELYLPLVRR